MRKKLAAWHRAFDFAIVELERAENIEELDEPLRVVIMVSTAQGIIDNGGLQYFFENNFPEKPPYALFVDAYRAIGAKKEAAALESSINLFPFARPERFRGKRNAVLDKYLEDGGHRKDSPFEPFTHVLCGSERVWECLERYVRKHQKVFRKK